MSESFAKLFKESLINLDMKPGVIIKATVLSIDNNFVIVDVKLKSEGVISISQFKDQNGKVNITIGDTVEVVLEALEDNTGEIRLSHDKAKKVKLWKKLEILHLENKIIQGQIIGKVKGGFTVDLSGIRAFLPGSLVDVRPIRDISFLENCDVDFKLIKLDPKRNNIVVSRRAIIEAENSAERQNLIKNLVEDQEIKGIVKNLTDYGVFVDLGGIDGLLHITDMSWKRVKHPSELVKIGDEITVKILKFDRERLRVSLGLKQLGMDPWKDLVNRFPKGKKTKGIVSNITDYGCFVDLGDGAEGLVHVSEMDWTTKNINPSKFVQLGQTVEVMILDIDRERRRISLGLKQCIENPWKIFDTTNQIGDKVSGKIKSITDFGIFIGLNNNIDGLIHLSDLSWIEIGNEAIKKFTKGDLINAIILGIDVDRERISLGIKQLTEDPILRYTQAQISHVAVKGIVYDVNEYGAYINLEKGVKGYIKAQDLDNGRVEDARHQVNIGDEITAMVINIDRKKSTINLSISSLYKNQEKRITESYKRNSDTSRSNRTTLGELIKEKIQNKNK